MRIASLVPSATETLFALGLGDRVVAVTHECDFPPAAERLPRLTRSVVPAGLEPAEIDRRVREVTGRGEALYELDEGALRELEPDLIVTQALCAVCAVSYDDVCALCARLPSRPKVIPLDPETLPEVLADLPRLARAAGEPERGERPQAELQGRLDAVERSVAGTERPRVVALEWLDPPYVGGHWVPEMVELAGGLDVLGPPGRKSHTVTWEEVADARPDVIVVMPCGLYADEAAEQAEAYRERLAATRAARVVAVDAASSFSRPGPRLADGVELLAHIFHPQRIAAPEWLAWRELQWESAAPSSPSR
jgi:iron complex transport system substrate-binding protein